MSLETNSKDDELIGRFINGICHDFNNILTQLYTFIEIVSLEKNLGKDSVDSLDYANKSLDQAAGLIEKLKTISRPLVKKDQSINPIIEVVERIESVKLLTSSRIIFVNDVPDSIRVRFDKISFSQVLNNLLDNAIFAVAHVERPQISISVRIENESLEISVNDNGGGVPLHIKDLIFAPYFSTKEKGIGTGIGLSIVKSIIESYGGTIQLLEKKPDAIGATFKIILPLLSESEVTSEGAQSEAVEIFDLIGKKIAILDSLDGPLRNHLFILNKLKVKTKHFDISTSNHIQDENFDLCIMVISDELLKFGLTTLVRDLSDKIPLILVPIEIESVSFIQELVSPRVQLLEMPFSFKRLSSLIVKLSK